MVTENMNGSNGKRTLSNSYLSKPILEEIGLRIWNKSSVEEALVAV